MTRVQEMGQGITEDDATASDLDNRPSKTVRKAKDRPQDKPKSLLDLQLPEPVKRSYEAENVGTNKVQKTEIQPSAVERAVIGYDVRCGQTGSTNQSVARSQPSSGGSGWGYKNVISDLAYNLKKQNTNNQCGSALNKLHNAGLRLSLRPEVEYVEESRASRHPESTWICNLYMGDSLLASAQSNNKQNSKTAAAEKALLILESSRFTIQAGKKWSKGGRRYTQTVVPADQTLNSQTFPVNLQNKCGAPPPTGTIEKFVLTEPAIPVPATSILINSAQSNHIPIEFQTSNHILRVGGKSGFVCTTVINGVIIDTGIHMNRSEARNVSAENALATLRKTCPTLRRNIDNAQASAIPRDEFASGQPPKDKKPKDKKPKDAPIKDSNLGHKMLKMMGWAGGALGKGDGIIEPIQASDKFSREGFGYTVAVPKNSANQIDLKAVRKIIEDYVRLGRHDDLIFSSELSSDERRAIHLICRRFNLKSQSHGKGAKRFLAVRPKRNLHELVKDVVESGGTSGQYELVTPGQEW